MSFAPTILTAADSSRSAVRLGYLTDPYVSLLYKAPRIAGGQNERKAPLINVGTHHRTAALDAVVDSFLKAAANLATSSSSSGLTGNPGIQIVSLGAGSDTRFWRLAVCPIAGTADRVGAQPPIDEVY